MATARSRDQRAGAREGMRPGRVGLGERLAAASGVALVVLMAFEWFADASAWQLQATDLLLLAIALAAVVFAVARALGRDLATPHGASIVLTVAGGVAVGAMLALVLESSGGTVALVASLAAAAGIMAGGVLGLRSGGG